MTLSCGAMDCDFRTKSRAGLELGVRRHVAARELARAALDLARLCGIPCWPVRCRHDAIVEINVEEV